MKLVVVGHHGGNYLAKTHEAFRRGLQQVLNATLYGEGYPGYTPAWDSFPRILEGLATDGPAEVVLTHVRHAHRLEDMTFLYPGLDEIECLKVVPISDFWNMTDRFQAEFPVWLEAHDLVALSYYPQLPQLYQGTPWQERFRTVLPTFDPACFNDWGLPKIWDVGHIGSGVLDGDPFYPERQAIREQLLRHPELSCLWRPHPGWGDHPPDHPQVGRGFSRLINQCRFFICTGGRYNLPLARYFEVMASGTVLLAIEPEGGADLHLEDGVNYVRITPEDVLDKLDYYRARPERCAEIAAAGYRTAMRYHSCQARALDFHDVITSLQRRASPEGYLVDVAVDGWQEVVDTYLRTFRPRDPVGLLIPVASLQPGAPTVDDLQLTLLQLARHHGLETMPEVVALEHSGEVLDELRRFHRVVPLPSSGTWDHLESPLGRRLAATRRLQLAGR